MPVVTLTKVPRKATSPLAPIDHHAVICAWRDRSPMRLLGALVNVAIRWGMLAMLRHVSAAGSDDPRFSSKGIASRARLLVPLSQGTVPLLWLRRRGPYPFWMDDLYLSIVALDLAGNVLDLYDRYTHFDLIPHAHGSGAITVFFAWAVPAPMWSAVGMATVGHVVLEVQEYASDVLFGYRNVRGTWDVIGDLGAGIVGTAAYALPYYLLVRRHASSGEAVTRS
jgi:hypothetical protein